jgi:hypothetical protein
LGDAGLNSKYPTLMISDVNKAGIANAAVAMEATDLLKSSLVGNYLICEQMFSRRARAMLVHSLLCVSGLISYS